MIDSDDLARRIWERSYLEGEFELRSGAISNEYFDKYLFESDPALLRDVCEALSAHVPSDADLLAGLELGGVPVVAVLSQVTGLPAAFVRKRPKSYGTRRLAEGADVEGRRLVVVEDIVTSGGQVLESCSALRERGAEILRVLCVVDREEGGSQALATAGLQFRALFTPADLARAAGQTRD